MYKQSKVSDINIHHFGFRFSGLVPIRDVAAASLLALYAVYNSRAPVCIPKPARARRASTDASRRRAMALGAQLLLLLLPLLLCSFVQQT